VLFRSPLETCRSIVSSIVETDLSLRSGGGAFDKLRMQVFLYSTMRKGGAGLLPYETGLRA
jgi:hypothetical protein